MYSTLPTKCMKSFCVVEKAAICTVHCLCEGLPGGQYR